MMQSPSLIWSILFFSLAISPLVFIHEGGHYLIGRLFGVKAEVFSIGFGGAIASWVDSRGTRWQVGWLPLGGYVRFAGDMNAVGTPSDEWLALPAEERNRTFQSKAVWQRALIVLAGPLTNFLFAIIVFIGLFGAYGEPRTPPVVSAVQPGSAADRAGLQAGDRIVAIAGQGIDRFEDIARIVQIHPEERLTLRLERRGRLADVVVTPATDVLRDRFGNELRRGLLGVSRGKREVANLAFYELPGAAVRFTADSVRMMADTLWQVVAGVRSVKDLGGPVKIAQVSGEQAMLGPIDFLLFMTMISINLGFINLLPIPMLDGGHLAFYAVEAVRQRPVGQRAQEWAQRTGMVALLAFMMFVTVNDLAGLGLWNRLAGLID